MSEIGDRVKKLEGKLEVIAGQIKPEGDDEECAECMLASAIGESIKVCSNLKSKNIDCDDLYKKIVNGDITPSGLVEKIMSEAKTQGRAEDSLFLEETKVMVDSLWEKVDPEFKKYYEKARER